MRDTLQPGLTFTLEYVVPESRTVPRLLPEAEEFAEMPPVLATGYLVGIIEWACMRALREHLDENEGTLGIHLDVSHDAPTLPGTTMRVSVKLVEVDRRALLFEIEASDENGAISAGTHRRGVIDRERFASRLRGMAESATS